MGKLQKTYNYADARFSALRDSGRAVTAAYQSAARGMDSLKEWVLIELGLPNTADAIHRLAHLQPERFDQVGDILHQRHLMQEYPATPEYTKRPETLDEVFEEVIAMLQRIEDSLRDCVLACDELKLWALAREFENLQTENSRSYEKFLYAWQMYDRFEGSETSYDSWISRLFEQEG